MRYWERESWRSKVGFIFAALGSAVGLGSIWRFPYIVGENGGAAFIFVYLFCLLLIGFPVFVAEILIGRSAQTSPFGAFRILGRNKFWATGGKMTIITGFIISSFYSVIAGWALGYLVESVMGSISHFSSSMEALLYFEELSSSPVWTVSYHFLFLTISLAILFTGVRRGIEAASKIMMPLLLVVLVILVIKGLTLPSSSGGLKFLFSPDWGSLTLGGIVLALGQAFFTLSLGQGTMITYGSYLSRSEDIPKTCWPVVVLNTLIALLMGIAIFSIVFSVGIEPQVGPALLFETLPVVFSQVTWGWGLAVLFFFLVTLAALTSEISALEPIIAYLIDEKGWSRKKAVSISVLVAFLLGIPSALSFSWMRGATLFGATFFDIISFFSVNILVPLGGLLAVLLVGWRWGIKEAFDNLKVGPRDFFLNRPTLAWYFRLCLKWISPLLIIIILFSLLGFF